MQAIFGGLIAVILLGLYVHFIRVATLIVHCSLTLACTTYPVSMFNEGMAQALSVIGGLVTTLVITELAVTKAGELPAVAPSVRPRRPTRRRSLKPSHWCMSWFGLLLVSWHSYKASITRPYFGVDHDRAGMARVGGGSRLRLLWIAATTMIPSLEAGAVS